MNVGVDFQPIGKRAEIESGTTVLEAAREAGVGISAICGGLGSCNACRVHLEDQEEVSEPNEVETGALGPDDLAAGFRLACQTEIYGPVRVDVPPESMTAPQRTQVEGEEIDFEFDPPVDILELTLSNPGVPLLGMAVDIGTTKIAGYLVDMASGETLAMKGIMNPQIAYGEDVMARITHCLRHEEGREVLQRAVVDAINGLAQDLCAAARAHGDEDQDPYAPSQIVASVMVGNTAMHHLLLGLPVEQLGLSPYVAAVSSPLDVRADELGLAFSPGATIHLLANIAGFVGADHLSMLLATNTHRKSGVVVSLDIGTNTEITLAAKGRMIACSTASGPAFEGAHIRDGMRAADGAIERIQIIDDKLVFQTVGHTAPVGICGSGILDAIAQLRLCGAMNEKGGLDEEHPLIRMGEELPEALIVDAKETGHGHDIALSRRDINEIQLAKGAIRAGIELLFEEAGVKAEDVDEFIIAGAFGTYISVESALVIGMFPDIPLDRFRQVGNAAGIGAKQALLSKTRRTEAAGIGERVEYLELTVSPRFQEEFLKGMYL
jgi:uncharacterized 2Fe-2S/4Fe-4S cluster protein (DUF4445 family)